MWPVLITPQMRQSPSSSDQSTWRARYPLTTALLAYRSIYCNVSNFALCADTPRCFVQGLFSGRVSDVCLIPVTVALLVTLLQLSIWRVQTCCPVYRDLAPCAGILFSVWRDLALCAGILPRVQGSWLCLQGSCPVRRDLGSVCGILLCVQGFRDWCRIACTRNICTLTPLLLPRPIHVRFIRAQCTAALRR